MHTLKRLDAGVKIVRDALLLGMEYFDEHTGRVPNLLPYSISGYERRGPRTLPSAEYYYTADATLLFFLLSQRYIEETKDSGLASKILETFIKTFQRYQEASLDSINGPPAITENGLLTCVPWHSWTDSKREIVLGGLRVKDLATRAPREWQVNELRKGRSTEEVWSFFNRPIFYLPEINALWIRALEAVTAMSEANRVNTVNPEVIAEAKNILTSAKENYPRVFWNEGKRFLYDIVSLDLSLRDDTLGSCGIMAASLLRNLLPQDMLESIWKATKDHLLISRRVTWLKRYMGEVLPFGVIVKDYGDRAYLGDEQYHGAVVWPRDTPLLIGILERLGATDVIRGLLVSNLDHQMGEGAVFYNHELFSLPTGRNPSPIKESADNPVPVKNPIQFWSQWVDPYLSYEI
jgi:glycogen debranching enzyme